MHGPGSCQVLLFILVVKLEVGITPPRQHPVSDSQDVIGQVNVELVLNLLLILLPGPVNQH